MRLVLIPGLVLATALHAQSPRFIHLDQFGYLPGAEKVAVCADPREGFNAADAYAPPGHLVLERMADGARLARFAVQDHGSGAVHEGSGDRGWWVDFSAWTLPGTYRLVDTVTPAVSPSFRISDTVYRPVLRAAGRMFYHNRCGTAKPAAYAGSAWADAASFLHPGQDAECRFIGDPGNAALARDLRGGWFDAGDYNKYVPFAVGAVHDLLWAYREHPLAFTDDWNIPESGNGIPDLLDEVAWELDWLLRMVDTDGSVPIKMGSRNYAENVSAPPSANTDPRFYGPDCSSSALSAWLMLTEAALVFRDVPGRTAYADTLAAVADRCWAHLRPILALGDAGFDTDCDDGSIVAGDADRTVEEQRALVVAGGLRYHALTGDTAALRMALDLAYTVPPLSTGYWDPYPMVLIDALLEEAGAGGAAFRDAVRASLESDVIDNDQGFWGFQEDDLYRAYMPPWSYHWGSHRARAGYGLLQRLVLREGLAPTRQDALRRAAAETVHAFHGVNPLGLVYLSAMGPFGAEHGVTQIYHTAYPDGSPWDQAGVSAYGPPPGFLVGGPNAWFSDPSVVPPAGQPRQKAYADRNDDWPIPSWEISEPAIYYQAAYVRLLAAYAERPAGPSGAGPAGPVAAGRLDVRPLPCRERCRVRLPSAEGQVRLSGSDGSEWGSWTVGGPELELDLRDAPAGLYVLQWHDARGHLAGTAVVPVPR